MTKFFLISSAMMLTASAMTQAAEPIKVEHFYTMQMSPDGQYLISRSYEGSSFYEIATNKYTDLENMMLGNGNAISDKGIVVGSTEQDSPMIFINGEVTYPVTLLNKFQASMLNAVTNDGSRICGIALNAGTSMMTEDRQMYLPMVMDLDAEGNVSDPVMLPHPEKDLTGRVPQYCSATWISDDGKTILGNVVDYSGAIIYPILYKENEAGEWSYTLPTESLLNPSHLVLPEDPGEFAMEQPQAVDYMDPDKAAEYEAAIQAYYNSGYQEELWPNAADYMTEEQIAAYNAVVDEYNAYAKEFNDKLFAYYEVFDKIIEESTIFMQNAFTMDADGSRIALLSEKEVDNGGWFPEVVASVYIINLEDGSMQIIETGSEELIPNQYTTDGTLVLSNPASSETTQSYLLLPGENEFTSVMEYLESVNPTYAAWVKENFVAEQYVESEPDEEGYTSWIPVEVPITGHVVMSADKSVISGGTVGYDENWNSIYTSYVLTDVLSGVSQAVADGTSLKAYKGGCLTVEGDAADIAVYDLSGRMVFNAAGVQGNVETRLADGIYVVRATANGNTTSLKVRF